MMMNDCWPIFLHLSGNLGCHQHPNYILSSIHFHKQISYALHLSKNKLRIKLLSYKVEKMNFIYKELIYLHKIPTYIIWISANWYKGKRVTFPLTSDKC